MAKAKKLYRTTGKNRKIAGVCGGLAEYMGVDPTIMRVIFLILMIAYGFTFWAYIIMWLIVPEK